MKLLKQNGPFCLVYSAAMVLDEDPEVLHKEIGTNGTEIWWGTTLMRGIHIQEIQDCFLKRNKCLYPIEHHPHLAPADVYDPKPIYTEQKDYERFFKSVVNRPGILITRNHAVAWDGAKVYDPKGFIGMFYDYIVNEAWLMADLIS